MKLLTGKKRKVAVLLPSGLGDSVLFIPLLKELKRKGFLITGLFYSEFDNDIFYGQSFLDSRIVIRSRLSFLLYSFTRFRHFANCYLNHLANGSFINLAAHMLSRRVTRTDIHKKVSSKRTRIAIADLSDVEQNLHLLYSIPNSKIRSMNSFQLQAMGAGNTEDRDTFILQVSAGNNTTPFKNWPVRKWVVLTERLCRTYPGIDFIIAGDASETGYSKDFEKIGQPNCRVLIGKTTVKEIVELTKSSRGYIGLDSGLMHIAAAFGKKTLTIFGASNERLYGYEQIDPANHKVITAGLSCRPCSGWKNANRSRVTDPMRCPDLACLSSIQPDTVFEQVVIHFGL